VAKPASGSVGKWYACCICLSRMTCTPLLHVHCGTAWWFRFGVLVGTTVLVAALNCMPLCRGELGKRTRVDAGFGVKE
jgi:hypothetical protein